MTHTWTAPGRVNLIGEHVDYNDGLVLPFALPYATTTTVRATDSGRVDLRSEGVGETSFPVTTEPGDVTDWSAYVAGVVWVLAQEGWRLPGLDVEVTSDVPLGAGLSSSAALSCAVAAAITDEIQSVLQPLEIARVARLAENEYVGAQTGVMDQLAAVLSTPGHATYLDCRSLRTRQVPLELRQAGLRLLLLDTQARHALVTSAYGERRKACETAAELLGFTALRDADLLSLGRLKDGVLRRRAHHVVTEIERVQTVVSLLEAGHPADIGAQLTASHYSLRDDFEVSCDELDVTVDAALDAGSLGARMVGGGFGGCVIALCRNDEADVVVQRVRSAFEQHGWDAPAVWDATPSHGARRVS